MKRSTLPAFNPLDYPICLASPRRVKAISWQEHIPFAMALVQMLRPRLLVELGVHTGDSYLAFCQAVAEARTQTRAFGVDTWHGDAHSGHYAMEVLTELREYHDPLYGGFSTLLESSFDAAAAQFADSSIDLLHIDGYHTYDAVSGDWQTWRRKLSPSGVVLFHDTNVRERDFGVWRLWAELQAQHPHFEFAHGHGLGVLAYGRDAADLLSPLLLLDAPARSRLCDLFYLLRNRLTLLAQSQSQAVAVATLNAKIEEYDQALRTRNAERDSLNARLTSEISTLQAELSQCRDWVAAVSSSRVYRYSLGGAKLIRQLWRLLSPGK